MLVVAVLGVGQQKVQAVQVVVVEHLLLMELLVLLILVQEEVLVVIMVALAVQVLSLFGTRFRR